MHRSNATILYFCVLSLENPFLTPHRAVYDSWFTFFNGMHPLPIPAQYRRSSEDPSRPEEIPSKLNSNPIGHSSPGGHWQGPGASASTLLLVVRILVVPTPAVVAVQVKIASLTQCITVASNPDVLPEALPLQHQRGLMSDS